MRPTIWLTGLSQSGKTTVAEGIADWLRSQGIPTQVLDGKHVREEIGDFLGYSRDERNKVSRIIAAMARLLNQNGVAVVTTSITPYEESRTQNRVNIPGYFEVYVECDVETCIERDTTNNYARAMRGDLKHFIGVDDPFEVPKNPDLVINTQALDADQAMQQAIDGLDRVIRGVEP